MPRREAVVDTNVLLRYLTDEPRELADRAAAILERAEEEGVELVVPPLILGEAVYVLQVVYKWPREVVAKKLLEFLEADILHVPEKDILIASLREYAAHGVLDFADAYVAGLARARGHGRVISFDSDLDQLRAIERLDDPEQVARV